MTPARSRPRLPRKRQGGAEEHPRALEGIGEGRRLAALAVFRAIYRVDVPRKAPLPSGAPGVRRPTSTVPRRTPQCQES